MTTGKPRRLFIPGRLAVPARPQNRIRKRTPGAAAPGVPGCQKSHFAKNSVQKVFARLFRKGGGVKGRSPWRVPQDAKSFSFIRIRKGDATARWAVASRETLSRGFPMRRITPHLCILLSANQFFDTLGRPAQLRRASLTQEEAPPQPPAGSRTRQPYPLPSFPRTGGIFIRRKRCRDMSPSGQKSAKIFSAGKIPQRR